MKTIKKQQKEIVIDNFAGGGGASTGIENAIGRSVDVAINHDPDAIAMHEANHPNTKHYCESVWEVHPREVAAGRPVALCWLSPDCKHFSKAKGSTPVNKNIRGLAWIAVRWAATVRPRVIMLENVEEFKTWGPLIMTEDGPKPDPKKKGETFQSFVRALNRQGYEVEFRELRACDYGAPTTRKRLFMIARNDGMPIKWPEPTHGPRHSKEVQQGKLLPYHSAAECIDWTLPGTSIFGRKKPLRPNTMKRIARGLQKFVIDNDDPFVICIPVSSSNSDQNDSIGMMRDSRPSKSSYLTKCGHNMCAIHLSVNTSGHTGSNIQEPLKTITTGGHHMLISSFLAKNYGGNYKGAGIDLRNPTDTITQVDHHSLISAVVSKACVDQSKSDPSDINGPMESVCRCSEPFSPEEQTEYKEKQKNHEIQTFFEKYFNEPVDSGKEAAFLTKYYGNDIGQDLKEPLHTIPTKDRFGLVRIKGRNYSITDITMRMLQPHELAKAQGVPNNYILDQDKDGNKISKAKQVARIGNMVVPNCAEALVRSNLPEMCTNESYQEQVELLNEDFGWLG